MQRVAKGAGRHVGGMAWRTWCSLLVLSVPDLASLLPPLRERRDRCGWCGWSLSHG